MKVKTISSLVSKPRKPDLVKVPHYYVMSYDASRDILGFGHCKRGAWVEVPYEIYRNIEHSIFGGGAGWKIKIEETFLEVKQ
jgi:hypothetical protein